MCYMGCSHENYAGECKRRRGVCPLETEEEAQESQDAQDLEEYHRERAAEARAEARRENDGR